MELVLQIAFAIILGGTALVAVLVYRGWNSGMGKGAGHSHVAALSTMSGPGLDLTPRDYLVMLTDEHREYQQHRHANGYQVSMRKAINCCGLSNALPEIITAHYNPTDPAGALKRKADAFREELRQRCEAHHTVRDFCDYSKHAKLRRKSVSVKEAEHIKQTKGSPVGMTLAFTHAHDVELLVIRHQRGREENMDEVLEQVIASWNAIFDEDKL